MRIAYLITAYDQPEHLHRLVSALDCEECAFFIHIDGHVDLRPFAQAGLREKANVYFSPNRVKVQWMGFSQVESILALLSQAHDVGFDYCVLLSGSDYPIKSNTYLRSFYQEADQEFITFWRLSDRPGWQHKIQYHYPIDQIPILGWSKNTEHSYLRRFFWGRFHKYRHWMPRRRFPFDMVPYGGSDWWSLSQGCVRHILNFVEENPAYRRFYRSTHCPSEMFFHTIIMNSPWAERVRNFAEYNRWSATTSDEDKRSDLCMLPEDAFNMRYIDWSGVRTGERETPAILDERDWPRLVASADLFARKFHAQRSAGILGRIDREILGVHQPAGQERASV
jgi:hypothetical protein